VTIAAVIQAYCGGAIDLVAILMVATPEQWFDAV
jgi:hypothetical protein